MFSLEPEETRETEEGGGMREEETFKLLPDEDSCGGITVIEGVAEAALAEAVVEVDEAMVLVTVMVGVGGDRG
jgi:hypothetical protein